MWTAFLSDTRTGKPPLPNLKKKKSILREKKGKTSKGKELETGT